MNEIRITKVSDTNVSIGEKHNDHSHKTLNEEQTFMVPFDKIIQV